MVGVLFRIGLVRLVLGSLVCVFVCGVRVVAVGGSSLVVLARCRSFDHARLRFVLVVGWSGGLVRWGCGSWSAACRWVRALVPSRDRVDAVCLLCSPTSVC